MIANNQLRGEEFWFWYATLFHRGAKLYGDLQLPLQPLLVLEMNAWMGMFGRKLLVTEIPSVLHLLTLCAGLYLLLRESDWPDSQKSIVLASAFVFWIKGSSYRFDDFHVTTEVFTLFCVILQLQLGKINGKTLQLAIAAASGILCGLAITSRVNDGLALLTAVLLCELILVRENTLVGFVQTIGATGFTVILVVRATGDSFRDYVSNTLIKAADDKGGIAGFSAGPLLLFRNSAEVLLTGRWLGLVLLVLIGVGALSARKSSAIKEVVSIQIAIVFAIFAVAPAERKVELLHGITQLAIPFLSLILYLLSAIVVARSVKWKMQLGRQDWDPREVLIFIPLAELASLSISSAAKPLLGGYCSQIAILLLLVAVIQPRSRQITWANASFLTVLVMSALLGAITKVWVPYAWDSQVGKPMFVDRHWYRHPVYGPMYLQSDLLSLSTSICLEIEHEASKPELLSLPFSYPNYFCDVPPWRGYVQTFFDTSSRANVERLIMELRTGPPQWIVYQRQLVSLAAHEQIYNHGQPLAQRDLDDLIMQKLAAGDWRLIDLKYYQGGDGWYVIRTQR